MAKETKQYRKHIYWLTEKEVSELKKGLKRQRVKVKQAKGIVCTPLDRINKIAVVAPEVWNETCGRQGSWYRTSEKNGLYLVISAFRLDDFEEKMAAVITESDFVLPAPASPAEKEILLGDPRLLNRIPAQWGQVGKKEEKIYLRWGKRLGASIEDYNELYRTHTANHANFISPKFFMESANGIIPYSIDKSAHLCSCCVELFQILGSEFKKKLVAPCPGAVIFARLKPDRFLLVEKPST